LTEFKGWLLFVWFVVVAVSDPLLAETALAVEAR
jgi:hypothetical protein